MVKNLLVNTGVGGLIPGWGRSPGEGNSNSFQYSCLEYPMGRGSRWATIYRVTKESHTTQWLSNDKKQRNNAFYLLLRQEKTKVHTRITL